jgi:riboflavin transporter FmnP
MNQSTTAFSPSESRTKKLVLMAILAAIAYLCTLVFRIPVMGFLTYEPKDVVILIGAFLLGPMEGVMISGIVSLIEMVTISSTGPIGMIMNFLATCTFILPAAFLYRKKRSPKSAVVGLIFGIITMTGAMLLWNYLVTPYYLLTPRETVKAMLLPVFLPFNLIKGGINAALTLLIYKPVATILRKTGMISPNSQKDLEKDKKRFIYLFAALLLLTCVVALVFCQVFS